jgi:DNA-binding NarL/FixJ family response regulator
VAVVSVRAATSFAFDCPLVVCELGEPAAASLGREDGVLAVLPRHHVTPDQLVSAVRAASVGLSVKPSLRAMSNLDSRSIEVLQLLSEGAATREISRRLGYSERTIKGIIREINLGLGARSRAHAVATALREHLI